MDGNAVAGRPGIAASSAINVSSVSGSRRFGCGEKIAGIGRTRRHGASLQRGRASSENHRYPRDEGASRVSENVLLPLSGSWNQDGTPNVLECMTTSPPLPFFGLVVTLVAFVAPAQSQCDSTHLPAHFAEVASSARERVTKGELPSIAIAVAQHGSIVC